jgi:L-ascorbate metabolism protein UlaG (beta-lactamase superfamily)
VELVTASHVHTDHLDAASLLPLAAVNPGLTVVYPLAIQSTVQQRLNGAEGVSFLPLDAGLWVSSGPFQVLGIPAAHNTVERDEAGHCRFLGFVVKFGKFCLYHSGDTLWHEDLVPMLLPHHVDVALVPINGNLPARRVAGNLNGTQAAALAKAIGAKLAIPHHFHLFEFNTAEPTEFSDTCQRLGQPCVVLPLGGHVRLC